MDKITQGWAVKSPILVWAVRINEAALYANRQMARVPVTSVKWRAHES